MDSASVRVRGGDDRHNYIAVNENGRRHPAAIQQCHHSPFQVAQPDNPAHRLGSVQVHSVASIDAWTANRMSCSAALLSWRNRALIRNRSAAFAMETPRCKRNDPVKRMLQRRRELWQVQRTPYSIRRNSRNGTASPLPSRVANRRFRRAGAPCHPR